jgi:hypothetical protein
MNKKKNPEPESDDSVKERQRKFFARGHLARVRAEKARSDREMLTKTSLKDIVK